MEILWLAIVFYSIGLGIVLYLRPSIMFHSDGTWKEFGYQKGRLETHTWFPFWLFSLVWAFGSYALAASVVWRFLPVEGVVMGLVGSQMRDGVGVGVGDGVGFADQHQSSSERMFEREQEQEQEQEREEEQEREQEEEEEEEEHLIPVSRVLQERSSTKSRAQQQNQKQKTTLRPGFYTLDPHTQAGVRKYIYYGTQRPTDIQTEDIVEEKAKTKAETEADV